MRCKHCREPILEVEIEPDNFEFEDCDCFQAVSEREKSKIKLKGHLDRFMTSESLKLFEMDRKAYLEMKDNERMESMTKDLRMKLMTHHISTVSQDMIKGFYLEDSKVNIPESYFWKIRVENPRLCLSDYIDHIWKLQSEGIDPTSGDAKLVVYDGWTWVNGRRTGIVRSFTAFKYKYFIKKAEDTGKYDGHEIEYGIGDYFDPVDRIVKQESFVKCKVHRKDRKVPLTYTAWLPEFIKKDRTGKILKRWAQDPMLMLTKSAITNALKQAFPKELDMAVDFDSFNDVGVDDD